jgi:hypothetical protein
MLGIVFPFGFSAILIGVWSAAYQNGGSILVTINQYGEMYLELVLFCLVVPVMLYGIWKTGKRWYTSPTP